MKKLVIFDCDGVLVDSEHLASQVLVDCLSELQITMSVDEALRRFKGRRLADCLAEIERLENRTLPQAFDTTYRERMSECFESHLRPIHGVDEAIKRIAHIKCVATNGPLDKAKRNLALTGLLPHFGENVFSAYVIQKWKPDPELFLHACREMGSTPQNCVVIEDSASGIQAARAGGFTVLAFGQHASTEVISFQDMTELPELVERAFSKKSTVSRTEFTD